MTSESTKMIEINGIKMEVDLRQAIRIERLSVGTPVKILLKSYSSYEIKSGVIIGFEPFEKLPTILIAYVDVGYTSTEIKYLSYNAKTEDTEVIAAINDDKLSFDKNDILNAMEREILKKQREIQDIQDKRSYFLDKFQTYWVDAEDTTPAESEVE